MGSLALVGGKSARWCGDSSKSAFSLKSVLNAGVPPGVQREEELLIYAAALWGREEAARL